MTNLTSSSFKSKNASQKAQDPDFYKKTPTDPPRFKDYMFKRTEVEDLRRFASVLDKKKVEKGAC